MKPTITRCCIFSLTDSEITVTNPDKTTATFSTPSTGKDHDTLYSELRTLADAYISAFEERPRYQVITTANLSGDEIIVEPAKNAA